MLTRTSKTILWNTVATECQGDGDLLNNLRIKNVLTGEEADLPVSGLFYAIGAEFPVVACTGIEHCLRLQVTIQPLRLCARK